MKETSKKVKSDVAKRNAESKPATPSEKVGPGESPAVDRTTLVLAGLLGKVARCLVMCAPQFPAGSEGAKAVEMALKSIPFTDKLMKENSVVTK